MTGTAPPPLHCPRHCSWTWYLLSTAVMLEDVAGLDTGDQPSPASPDQPLLAELCSYASCLGVATVETGNW